MMMMTMMMWLVEFISLLQMWTCMTVCIVSCKHKELDLLSTVSADGLHDVMKLFFVAD